jgi:hypothetical protein
MVDVVEQTLDIELQEPIIFPASLTRYPDGIKRRLVGPIGIRQKDLAQSRHILPPPVRAGSIPKKNGGQRILCVPTVANRVAHTVVKEMIEPALIRFQIL